MSTRRRGTFTRCLLMVVAGLLASLPVAIGRAQQPASSRPLGQTPGPLGADREDNALAVRMAAQQAKGQNVERQKKLVSDTERLLSLATELKQQVDRTDKNTLSVDVIKKADEIEKLAHSVKERMKG